MLSRRWQNFSKSSVKLLVRISSRNFVLSRKRIFAKFRERATNLCELFVKNDTSPNHYPFFTVWIRFRRFFEEVFADDNSDDVGDDDGS